MKVLIDASSINKKNVLGSIPNYIFRLIDGFLAYSSFEIVLLVDYDFKDFFEKKYPAIPIHYLKRNYILYRIPFLGEIYGRRRYKKTIAKISYDVELIASDLDRSTGIDSKHPRILVIHDLKAIKDGNIFQKKKNIVFYKKLINNVQSIIAISNYTKNDLIKFFNIKESKITVIPNSIQVYNHEKEPNKTLPRKFILYVNTLLPYKNPLTLIKAYEVIKNEISNKLIFIGKATSYWKNEIIPYIKKHNLSDSITHLQDLSKEELQYIYNRASLFVSTSKREGFGYTPIEAAMSNIPVICSTCEALPFSTQGLLNYYEPVDDYTVLANKMRDILNNPPSDEKLKAIATKFKEDYAPEQQIERFSKLFQKMDN